MKKWSSDPLGFGGHGSHPFHSGWRWTHHTKKGHQNYQVLYKSWRFFPKLEASATFASHKKRRYLNLMKGWFPPKKKHDLQASTKKHGKIELLEIHTYFVCVSSYCFLWGRIHYIICIPDVWYMYTLGAGGSPKVLWVGYCEWLKIVISLWRNVSFWRSHSLHRIVICADEIFLIRVLIDQKSIIHTFIFVRNVWFVW